MYSPCGIVSLLGKYTSGSNTKTTKEGYSKMSTRKRPERNQPSPRLRARALAIINSDKYDRDTRASIAFQLKTNYSDLADMVRDAEKGVTICDVVGVLENQRLRARRVLPEISRSAKKAEDLLRDPKTLGSVRAQLQEAVVSAAAEMGIDIFHPAIVRQVFIEIFRERGRRFAAGDRDPIGYFEKPTIQLLTVVDYGAQGLGPVSVEEEDRPSRENGATYGESGGLDESSRKALQDFVIRAQLRQIKKQLEADAA
jgi:hypothetical protein